MNEPTVCVVCGAECSFIRTIDGLCLPCSDGIQVACQNDPTFLMKSFVKACWRVKELEVAQERTSKIERLLHSIWGNQCIGGGDEDDYRELFPDAEE